MYAHYLLLVILLRCSQSFVLPDSQTPASWIHRRQRIPHATTTTVGPKLSSQYIIVDDGSDNDDRRHVEREENNNKPVILDHLKRQDLLRNFSKDLENLTILRPRFKDNSLPKDLVSKGQGSTYTRLWTVETWRKHQKPPHLRYIRHIVRWKYSATAFKILPSVFFSAAWATFVSFISRCHYPLSMQAGIDGSSFFHFAGSSATVTALSAPLALLLTLRANQSVSRLLRARQLWGELISHCSILAGLAKTYLWNVAPSATLLLCRHLILLAWMLKAQVRGEKEDLRQVLGTMLQGNDLDWIQRQPKMSAALIVRMRQIVQHVLNQNEMLVTATTAKVGTSGVFAPSLLLLFEEQIQALEKVCRQCDGLLTSPIPPTYSRHLSRVLTMWLLCFPLSLLAANQSTWGTVVASTLSSYVLVGIDEVGMEIENAFAILPLQELAANVQQAVQQQFFQKNRSDGSLSPNELPMVPVD